MRKPAHWTIPLLAAVVAATGFAESDRLDDETSAALREAITDERHAQDSYAAVIARHGAVRPFASILRAEQQHERELLALFDSYRLEPPAREPRDGIQAPGTVREACARAVKAEERNVAMYDRFLKFVRQEDIRDTFTRLRSASRDRHLPAFERCATGGRSRR